MIRILFIILICMSSNTAHSKAGILNTKISYLGNVNGIWLELVVSNDYRETICLDSRMIGLDGKFSTSIFSIVRNGKDVEYIGVNSSRSAEFIPNQVVLLAQQVVKVTLNLKNDYDFSKKGLYKIKHQTFSGSDCFGKFKLFELISNEINISQ